MKVQEEYRRWRARELEDPALSRELESIEGKDGEIYDRFYTDLQFGTAGLRGVLGAGTNRMNIYTVRRATQAYADFLTARYEAPTAAVAYDSRINSELFAREAARVFAANGVRTWLYGELMPTPALSYAVRELRCQAGVNITASHNPSRYNGYKAYDGEGCQITGETAGAVMENIRATDLFDGVKLADYEEALASGMIRIIPEELIQKYLSRVLEEQVAPGVCRGAGLRLVYTPLNGAGRRSVLTVLEKMGVEDITVVPEQEWPDGNFPTCPYPNPEILEAMQKGLDLAEELGADLLLATDPDCDRVGAAVLRDGKPRLITGNEMGCLLIDFIARCRRERGTMPERPVVVKSIVTTTMADALCREYGIEVRSTLTGFKYIGEQLRALEEAGEEDRFLLGFEESYGYLSGGYVRDKDAVDGSMLICEMAAWYKRQGKDLGDALEEMYARFGRYLNQVDSYAFEGADGMAKMAGIMAGLRKAPPASLGGSPVLSVTDYETDCPVVGGIQMPPADVLAYETGAGSVIVRPSGTEPKLKVYYSVKAPDLAAAQALKAAAQKDMEAIVKG